MVRSIVRNAQRNTGHEPPDSVIYFPKLMYGLCIVRSTNANLKGRIKQSADQYREKR